MKFDVVRAAASILHVVPFNSEKKHGGVAIKVVIKFYRISFMLTMISNLYYFLVLTEFISICLYKLL